MHRTEFLYACERVCLQMQAKDGDVKEAVFDAPQLTLVRNGKVVTSKPAETRTGGTRPGATRARSLAR